MDNLNATGPVQDRDASENSIFKVAELLFLQKNSIRRLFTSKKLAINIRSMTPSPKPGERLGDCYLASRSKKR